MRVFICLCALCLLLGVSVFSQTWEETNGPYGGQAQSLLINAAGDLFAGTYPGVFRSTDNGNNWIRIDEGFVSPYTSATDLALTGSGHILVGTYHGVYISTNNGDNWEQINNCMTNDDIRALVVNGNGDIFAGTESYGVYRSTDGGENWSFVNTGLTNRNIRDLAVNSSDDLFAATYGGGVFRSTNDGAGWQAINAGLTDTMTVSLAIDSSNTIFAGTEGESGSIFRSTNNGSSWLRADSGISGICVNAFVFNSGGDVIAGASHGIYLSSDNGNTWEAISSGLVGYPFVECLAINTSDDLFASARNGGMYRSTDNGNSWQVMNNGMNNTFIPAMAINSSGDLFATGSGLGLFRSTDNGADWQLIINGLTDRDVRAVQVDGDGDVFAATYGGGIFRSLDNGDSWENVASGYDSGLTTPLVLDLVCDNSDYLYAGAWDGCCWDGGVFQSTDNGDTWIEKDNGLTNNNIQAMTANDNDDLFVGTYASGVFRSTNYGGNWVQINNGLTNTNVRALAVNESGFLFAGTEGGGVFRSTNNGGNWLQIDNGLVSNQVYALVVTDGGVLFAGGGFSGVFRSTNNGDSWHPIDAGLPASVYSFAAYSNTDLFAGTNGRGVYRLDLTVIPPEIILDPGSLSYRVGVGGSLPDDYLIVTNNGDGALNWTASNSSGWLNIDPTSGVDSGAITLTYTIGGLPLGTYYDTIVVSDPYASNSPQISTLEVTVYEIVHQVTTLADAGIGSLRWAINLANSNPGVDTITFAVDGTIMPDSALPLLTDNGTAILGSTAPGGAQSVILDGTNTSSASGLMIMSSHNRIEGLDVRNFNDGIAINGTARGNIIGPDNSITGSAGNGVSINGVAADSNLVIGNTISGNTLHGVYLTGTAFNRIGGYTEDENNSIFNNQQSGIYIYGNSDSNQVIGNRIGVNLAGEEEGNLGDGVAIDFNCDGARVDSNLIAGNGGDGIMVIINSRLNTLTRNIIYDNGGIAIDLGDDGVTVNDPGDLDDGPNALLNYPEVDSVLMSPDSAFALFGKTAENAVVEIFMSHPAGDSLHPADTLSGHGPAYDYIGRDTADAAGDFAYEMPGTILPFSMITMTATDGTGNTSELSENIPLMPMPMIIVTYTFNPEKSAMLPQNGVNMIVEDPSGDTIGRDADNNLIDQIPGAAYIITIDDDDSVYIPHPIIGDYTISFIAETGGGTGSTYASIIRVDGSQQVVIDIDIVPSTGEINTVTYTFEEGGDYINGDATGDGSVNIGDAVFTINYIFKGGPAPEPMASADANCDVSINIADAVYVITYVFKGGPAPCAFER